MIKEVKGLAIGIDLLLKTVHEKHCVKQDRIKKMITTLSNLLSSNEITDKISIENFKALFDRLVNLEKKVGTDVADEDVDCIAIHESIDTIKSRFFGESNSQRIRYEVGSDEMVARFAAKEKERLVEKNYPLILNVLNQIYKKMDRCGYGKALKEAFDSSAVDIVNIPSVAKLIIIELLSNSPDESLKEHYMEFFKKDSKKIDALSAQLLELHQIVKELTWRDISTIILLNEDELKAKAKEANHLMLALIKYVDIPQEDFKALISCALKNSVADVREIEDKLVEDYNKQQDDLKIINMLEKRRNHRF